MGDVTSPLCSHGLVSQKWNEWHASPGEWLDCVTINKLKADLTAAHETVKNLRDRIAHLEELLEKETG